MDLFKNIAVFISKPQRGFGGFAAPKGWWNPFTWQIYLSKLVAIFAIALLTFGFGSSEALANNYDKEFLSGSDFSGKDLQGSQFNKADLRDAKFIGSDLRGVSLFGANMTGADFSNADLRYSTLDTSRMDETNLKNALLEGAFAFGTNFTKAQIEGADFTDVDLRANVRAKLCEYANGTNSITKRLTRDTLECDL